MNKTKSAFVGIDVSKDTFSFHYANKDGKYKNSLRGWQKLLKEVPATAVFAMEATGVYHIKFASYLYSKGKIVKVLNPLRVKRWIQSRGNKAKTDKRDARLIFEYAKTKEASIYDWRPLTAKQARARAIVSILTALSRFENSSGNVNHAVERMVGKKDKDVLNSMSIVSAACREQKKLLQDELYELAAEIFPEKFRLLKTCPGIGDYTAAVMLVCAKGLEFETSGQLTSFVGVVPSVNESGQMKGKGFIVKTGNPYLRSLLFMCAFSSIRNDGVCKDLYQRLVAKGKAKPLAFTAVMHRIVKIAFGVVKSGEPYRGGNKLSLAA